MHKFINLLFFIITNLFSIELQKAKTFENQINDFSSWVMSEKLDGVRAYWDGKELFTKNGNKIYAPIWFTKDLPNFELDGELWTKRDDFENIQNIVLDKTPSKNWQEITYNIFEVPNQEGNFFDRLKVLENHLKQNSIIHLKIIPQIKIKDTNHLNAFLENLVSKKAEGVIIKNYTKSYFSGRSSDILKYKKFYDAEGKVIGISYNKDKSFKSLKIDFNGKIFNLGGGFSDKQKLNPPQIGQTVTFKYYSLSKNGIPKFASFIRVREKE